ncbi:MAG: ACT domain-containing protein, partial [Candidatus Woesearchaeota archaeon]
LAAVLSKKVKLGKNVVAIISGGNIDLSLLTQVIEKGEMLNNLLARFSFIIPDKPKALKDILSILARLRVNVESVSQDRLTTSVPLGHVEIIITLHTLGEEHINEIKDEFKKNKIKYKMLN